MNLLIDNIDKLHTTLLGEKRISNNLGLDQNENAVEYCKKFILNNKIIRRGKNYYCFNDRIVITVNAKALSIITAHKKRFLYSQDELLN